MSVHPHMMKTKENKAEHKLGILLLNKTKTKSLQFLKEVV